MKEITRIHLAQAPYNIEITAKKELEKYLSEIEKLLGTDADTLREIEARMVEILTERGVEQDKVITTVDVDDLKTRLGEPGAFIDADSDPQTGSVQKRFMRDERKGMIGGVLSGLAAYTKVDVVWLRIAAIILAFVSLGTALLLYVVLWIVVPPARTAAERLQMRGDAPTLENIQAETGVEVSERPSRKKPFVVLLRIVGVLFFVGTALGALGLVACALVFGVPVFAMYDWLMNSWLMIALIGASISGVLFTILMALCGYSIGAWRMTRSMMAAAVGITVLGLVSFGVSVGTGIYGGEQLRVSVESHTKTQRIQLDQLVGATEVQTAKGSLPIDYKVTTGEPYAEVKVLQRNGEKRIPLTITRNGTSATVSVQDATEHKSCYGLWNCQFDISSVTVYGPALKKIQASTAAITYEVERQDTLEIVVASGASVNVNGRIGAVTGTIARDGRVYADSAAVDQVNMSLEQGATVAVGKLQRLAVTVPTSCGTQSDSRITYADAGEIVVNGAAWQPTTGSQPTCATFERVGDETNHGILEQTMRAGEE